MLAFLGIADSWYLAQSAMDGAPLVCNIGSLDGCNTVAQSEYSRIFGIPLALYGVGFYALLFALGSLLFVYSTRFIYRAVLVLTSFGVIASVYFLFLQLFVIKATCIYCLASLVIAIFLCSVAVVLWRRFSPPHLVVVP